MLKSSISSTIQFFLRQFMEARNFIFLQIKPLTVSLLFAIFATTTITTNLEAVDNLSTKAETQQDTPTQDTANLARVALFKFTDNTNSAQYEWLATSLPEAISNALHARFEYADAPTEGILSPATREDADALAVLLKGDIFIYGSYSLRETQLVVNATIYNAAAKKIIGRVEVESPLNTRLFSAVDRLASDIVGEIYDFALAGKEPSGESSLKMLILVPSFVDGVEEQAAIREMENLKTELATTRPGNYITIYEFFDQNKVSDIERNQILSFARFRNSQAIVLWLKKYSIRDAFIVLVSANRVNITPVASGKPIASVTYSVRATPEMKQVIIQQAMQTQEAAIQKNEVKRNLDQKITLTQSRLTQKNSVMLYLTPTFSQSFLLPSPGLESLLGIGLHSVWYLFNQFEIHLAGTGDYGIKSNDTVSKVLLYTGMGGVGLTFRRSQFSFVPYIMAGAFGGRIQYTQFESKRFLMPAATGGVILGMSVSQKFDLHLKIESTYVIDETPALFATVGLGVGFKF